MKLKDNSIKSQVKHLMSLDQRFIDDRKHLILKVWESEGLILTKGQREIYMACAPADIITRRAREVIHEYPDMFVASPPVAERRYKHYKVMTDEFSKQNFLQRILKKRGI